MASHWAVRLRAFVILVLLGLVAACGEAPPPAPSPSIDDFFREFTDAWVRQDPNLAVRAQHFDGEEQDRLSRELTPVTRAKRLDVIRQAREGIARLATFDRDAMTPRQRVSADVMEWQLQSTVDSEPFLDYDFPLQQMRGVNVNVERSYAPKPPG